MNAPSPNMNPNAPPFPLNPVVGQRWLGWMWNGSMWVQTPAAGMQVLTTVFNVSGPYMPSPGLVSLTVECIGGGGGGAGAVGDLGEGDSGGGGGSGGYSRKTLPAVMVAGGVVITIGQGGAQGIGTGGGYVGQNGGPTSFGALCVANGGVGGGGGSASGSGGAGGAPGIGDVASPGAAGISGLQGAVDAVIWIHAGAGGTLWGGNQPPQEVANATAYPASAINGGAGAANTGAGGTGGASSRESTGAAGGPGGSGQCIVTEYCWADVPPGGECCGDGGARVALGFCEEG